MDADKMVTEKEVLALIEDYGWATRGSITRSCNTIQHFAKLLEKYDTGCPKPACGMDAQLCPECQMRDRETAAALRQYRGEK